jgi:hypothetical protein
MGEELEIWEHKFPKENLASALAEVKAVGFVGGDKKVVFSCTEGSVEACDLVENVKWRFTRAPKGYTSQYHAEIGLFCYSSKGRMMVRCSPRWCIAY